MGLKFIHAWDVYALESGIFSQLYYITDKEHKGQLFFLQHMMSIKLTQEK